MKKNSLVLFTMLLLVFSSCSSPKSIGKVSVMSERPIHFPGNYEVKALDRTASAPTLQEAIAKALSPVKDGLFITNATIVYVKKNLVKITGDVWGKVLTEEKGTATIQPESFQSVTPKIETGDKVQFVNPIGKVTTGRVISINGNMALVQYINFRNSLVRREFPLKALTKL